MPAGPGADAGLKRNDVIVGIREQAIDDEAALRFRLSTLNVGTVVPVKVMRAGKEVVVQLKLAAPPEDPPRDLSLLEGRQPLSGASVVNMSPAVAEEMGLAEWRPGIVIVEVKNGAYAGRFVRPGDMILAVNGQDVKNVADLKKRVASGITSISVGRDGVVFPSSSAEPVGNVGSSCRLNSSPRSPRHRWPNACVPRRWARSWARITCSGPKGRSAACWRRASSAR